MTIAKLGIYYCGYEEATTPHLAVYPLLSWGRRRPTRRSPCTTHGGEPARPVVIDWTCSRPASLDWLEEGDVAGWCPGDHLRKPREHYVYEIGYFSNINPTYGLMDSSGSALLALVLNDYGVAGPYRAGWTTTRPTLYRCRGAWDVARGAAWYHWSWHPARKMDSGDCLWPFGEFSAPGYKRVSTTTSQPRSVQRSGWLFGCLDCLMLLEPSDGRRRRLPRASGGIDQSASDVPRPCQWCSAWCCLGVAR